MPNTALPEAGPDGRARATALARLRLTDVVPTSVVEFNSRGRCLVVGAEDEALDLVRRLADRVACVVAVPGDATVMRLPRRLPMAAALTICISSRKPRKCWLGR